MSRGEQPEFSLVRFLGGKNIEGRNALRELNITLEESAKAYVERWEQAETVAIVLAPESAQLIQVRLLNALTAIEQKYGVELIIAGRDFPLHITMESAMPGEQEDPEARRKIEQDEELKRQIKTMEGKTYDFKYALSFKESILLVATFILPEVEALRKYLEELYQRHGMKPMPLNLLHVTLARFKHFPEGDSPEEKIQLEEKREQMIRELIELRHSISLTTPLPITVDHFFMGSNILGQEKI